MVADTWSWSVTCCMPDIDSLLPASSVSVTFVAHVDLVLVSCNKHDSGSLLQNAWKISSCNIHMYIFFWHKKVCSVLLFYLLFLIRATACHSMFFCWICLLSCGLLFQLFLLSFAKHVFLYKRTHFRHNLQHLNMTSACIKLHMHHFTTLMTSSLHV
jgi:hypothetical protein